MSSLPSWAAWAIVAGCPLLGPIIAFPVVFAIVALDRLITRAKHAPAVVPLAASEIGGYVRRGLGWGMPDPAAELVHYDPVVVASSGSTPPI
jgi:hypothetical protein